MRDGLSADCYGKDAIGALDADEVLYKNSIFKELKHFEVFETELVYTFEEFVYKEQKFRGFNRRRGE